MIPLPQLLPNSLYPSKSTPFPFSLSLEYKQAPKIIIKLDKIKTNKLAGVGEPKKNHKKPRC